MNLLLCGLGSLALGTLIGSVWKIKKRLLRELLLIFSNIIFVWAINHFVKNTITIIVIFVVAFIVSIGIGIFITIKQAKTNKLTQQHETIVSLLTGSIRTFIVYYLSSILAFAWYY